MLRDDEMIKGIMGLLLSLSTAAYGQSIATADQQDQPDNSQKAPIDSTAKLLPSETFVSSRQLMGPLLSPDGENLVYREQVEETNLLTIANLTTGVKIRMVEPEKIDLNWYRWAGNSRLLISMASKSYVAGEEVRETNLQYFDLPTKSLKPINNKRHRFNGDDILYIDPFGEYLLKSQQDTIYDYPSVYKVYLANSSFETIVPPQSEIWRWIADEAGVVRMGLSYKPSGVAIYYRGDATTNFKLISKVRDDSKDEEIEDSLLDVSHIVSGSDSGYVLSNKETGRFALYKFNYLTREVGEKIFDHPENDVTSYTLNDDGSQLRALRYTDARDRIIWFDPDMKRYQTLLEKAVPGQEIWMQAPTKSAKRIIVYTTSATDPGSYYLYQPAAKKLDRFGAINGAIKPALMSETQYIKYTARDGKEIPGYLTLPKGRAPKNLPLIILPHGGPYGVRDTLDFNAEVQFLASRGYAVLQPNYRGSDTYGEAFYKAGEGQIGRAMQDDLDDAMDWLVKQGVADAKRACLVGGSYGGYAALWGVIRNPERYRCAASFAGVTDWKKQLRYSRRFFNSRHAREWQTKVRGEKEFNLDLVSPTQQIARLTRPVLLAHGDDDSNVPISQYKAMLAAAKEANITLETKLYEDEGHGFSKRENEKDWYDRLEAFLNTHNPADIP
jgi:dipeptidyl aminopeptidase/acylaminoacyl peptidase